MSAPDTAAQTNISCARLARLIQAPLRRRLPLLFAGIVAGLLLLLALEFPHLNALALILCGALLPCVLWIRQRDPGMPLVVLLALQTLLIFATPILMRNSNLDAHSDQDVFDAAKEVLAYSLALAAGWALVVSRPPALHPPKTCWLLKLVRVDQPDTLRRASFLLLSLSATYQLGLASGALTVILDVLPNGAFSLIRTLFDASLVAGSLLGGYAIGSKHMSHRAQAGYWALLVVHFILQSSSILLSTNAGMIASATLGLFLGARRPPWVFLAITLSALALLNLGKFEMRAKYWNEHGQQIPITLADYPAYYAEWIERSVAHIGVEEDASDRSGQGQRLTDRLDNLQNLLFVQDAVNNRHIPVLGGATYGLIPPLLVPRIFWKDKPRTHEGQVMLNVHFGRQRLEDTFTTYIAWGLLAEAYANFGSLFGAIACGLVLGVVSGALERWIKPYPIAALEAFIFLILSVNLLLSFEMVASVWITSLFQTMAAMILGIFPFAEKFRISALLPENSRP